MESKVNLGIIGCSSIAERITIPAILESKIVRLQRIGSRDIIKAGGFARKFSCKNYGNYEDVLHDNDVEVVYISLPIGLQSDMVLKAAKAGKHIICEKSVTTSFASAKKMVKVCRDNRVRLMEGFSFRFHPQHGKILRLINHKPFVKPFALISKFLIPLKRSRYNFRFKKELGGGALNDLGCYVICTSRIIFDDVPISVNCRLFSKNHSDVDTYGSMVLQFSNNQQSFGIFGYENNFQANYEVICNNGTVFAKSAYNIRKDKKAIIDLHINNKMKTLRLQPVNQSRVMVENFCAEVRRKGSSFSFERDLLIQAQIMDAARLSNEKKRPVSIKEI